MTQRNATMGRYGMMAILCIAALAGGFGVAHWKMLPADTSSLPLFAVSLSLCCVVSFWLVIYSRTLLGRIVVPTAVVGSVASLKWAGDGMPIPEDLSSLSVYVSGEIAVLAGVTCATLLLVAKSKRRFEFQGNVQFSVAGLIFVITLTAAGFAAAKFFSPPLDSYQYVNDVNHPGGLGLYLVVSTLLTVIPVQVVFCILRARRMRPKILAAVGFGTLLVGILTAECLPVVGNPLWSCYALVPSFTTSLVALMLIVHRHCTAVSCPPCRQPNDTGEEHSTPVAMSSSEDIERRIGCFDRCTFKYWLRTE